MTQVHDRTAYALARIIADIDRGWAEEGKGPKAIIICSHAATIIAAGRALTGGFSVIPLVLWMGFIKLNE